MFKKGQDSWESLDFYSFLFPFLFSCSSSLIMHFLQLSCTVSWLSCTFSPLYTPKWIVLQHQSNIDGQFQACNATHWDTSSTKGGTRTYIVSKSRLSSHNDKLEFKSLLNLQIPTRQATFDDFVPKYVEINHDLPLQITFKNRGAKRFSLEFIPLPFLASFRT